MHTVVLEVRSLKETLADVARAMKTMRAEREARISFATPELLWDVLSAKRWDLLKALCGAGGTLKEGELEVQGEHRDRLRPLLAERGYVVKG